MRLPAIAVYKAQPEDRPERPQPATAQPTRLAQTLKGAHILAVDNEEDALGLLRVILESAGARVMTAASAPDALALLDGRRFDALIADIGMPGMDGLEMIRRIRQTLPPPVNQIPAAALTAYARADDRVAVLSSGFHMHLAKPVNPSELVSVVATLVGRTIIEA